MSGFVGEHLRTEYISENPAAAGKCLN